MNKMIILGLLLLYPLAFASPTELTIYSSRKAKLIKPYLDLFTEETGVTINFVDGKGDALLQKIKLEGKHTAADLVILADASRLINLQNNQLLQALNSVTVNNNIPEKYRAEDNSWIGLTVRARPIFYSKKRVDQTETELLTSYLSLSDPHWQNRVCMRSSTNIYNQSLVASLIELYEEREFIGQWISELTNNFHEKPKGGDTTQLQNLFHKCDLTVANTYYFIRMIKKHEKDLIAGIETPSPLEHIGVIWPNQEEGKGTHVNISGVGILKATKKLDLVKQFIEFMSSKDIQSLYSEKNGEYPVNPEAEVSQLLKNLGSFSEQDIPLQQLSKHKNILKFMSENSWL